MTNPLEPQVIEGLVRDILSGRAVFFVGAGFSIDSEQMSATRVIRRLLIRLRCLNSISPGRKSYRRFKETFVPEGMRLTAGSKVVEILAGRYYEINDWMCRVFGEFLHHHGSSSRVEDLPSKLRKREHRFRERMGKRWKKHGDQWKHEDLAPIELSWLKAAAEAQDQRALHDLGKLVLAETLGFSDPRVMAGNGYRDFSDTGFDVHRLRSEIGHRLRPRHHVLARLAREGLCPLLLTTNFDLLIESALRLSGLLPRSGSGSGLDRNEAPAFPRMPPHFSVIASPLEFLDAGSAFRTVTLVKLHGCAGRFRELRRERDPSSVLRYLRHVIYTYREIQHWRDDAWAADYLKTLVRTRSILLTGYSAADPIMHDTFRAVYQEMERKRHDESAGVPTPTSTQRSASAFFFAYSRPKQVGAEFHGQEVLEAATGASRGQRPHRNTPDHEHYLRFGPSNDHSHSRSQLNLDEMLQWIHHRTFRSQQLECAKSELQPLISRLWTARPASESQGLIAEFEALVGSEASSIKPSQGKGPSFMQLNSTLRWSSDFHVALRREWARAWVQNRDLSRFQTARLMEMPEWYLPANEQPSWTAWGLVVELALRKLARYLASPVDSASQQTTGRSTPSLPGVDAETISPESGPYPTVWFLTRRANQSPPVSLVIRGRPWHGRTHGLLQGRPCAKFLWILPEDAVPWYASPTRTELAPSEMDQANNKLQRRGDTHWSKAPPAAQIWRWATQSGEAWQNDRAAEAFRSTIAKETKTR